MSQSEKYPKLAAVVKRFAWAKPPPGCSIVYRVDPKGQDQKPRHFAACELRSKTQAIIYLAPKLEHMPIEKREGVLLHEIGHAMLFFLGQLDHSEREADSAAEEMFGREIYYDPDDLVQTVAGGIRPRPAHLR